MEQQLPRGCPMLRRKCLPKTLLSLALVSVIAVPVFADSYARVVRLSDVQGNVQIDRNAGQGFENAFPNLPLTQGIKIRTQERGEAALEFEDGSTVRLAPNTTVELPQLLLRDSGVKFSTVNLQEGTAYVNFLGTKDNVLEMIFARESVTMMRAVHLRIAMADVDAAVAVFKGEASVTSPKGTVEVNKNHTASFDLLDDRYTVASGVDESLYDSWEKQQSQYQQQYSNLNSDSYSSYSPYAYGSSDLNYYGNFFSLPGYGTLWQPYFTGAGWDPFMNGAWAFYPGLGYGWVSGYPWGWTPYHYGSWLYVPMYGWAWQPGGSWMGWNTLPVILNGPAGFVRPRPPLLPGRRIFAVNRGPAPVLKGSKVQITNNSAGLGVPRGIIRNLGQLSHHVEQTGFVNARVPTATTQTGFWHTSTAPMSRMGSSMGHGVSSMSHGVSSVGHSMGGAMGGGGHASGGGGGAHR